MTNPGQNPNYGGNNNNGQPAILQNNLAALGEFEIDVTVDSNGAITNALVIGFNNALWLNNKLSTSSPDQNHFAIGSSISAATSAGLTELNNFLRSNGLYCDQLRIVTSNTAMYTGNLYVGEMPFTGYPVPTKIPLQPYANTLGNGSYDTTLIISDRHFVFTHNFFMYISNVPASTTFSLNFRVQYLGNSITGTPVK